MSIPGFHPGDDLDVILERLDEEEDSLVIGEKIRHHRSEDESKEA